MGTADKGKNNTTAWPLSNSVLVLFEPSAYRPLSCCSECRPMHRGHGDTGDRDTERGHLFMAALRLLDNMV